MITIFYSLYICITEFVSPMFIVYCLVESDCFVSDLIYYL